MIRILICKLKSVTLQLHENSKKTIEILDQNWSFKQKSNEIQRSFNQNAD